MAPLKHVKPDEIEAHSFAIIETELREIGISLPPSRAAVIKRVIHTTADFSFADSLAFSNGAVEAARQALLGGACIVTDTEMARAGIAKQVLARYGGETFCFMSEEAVAAEAKQRGITRAAVSMEKAAQIEKPLLFAIGNAPTALAALSLLIRQGTIRPALVIGAPVGFVNVTESKTMLMESGAPYIVAQGRKGGSAVAAAICNALLYSLEPDAPEHRRID